MDYLAGNVQLVIAIFVFFLYIDLRKMRLKFLKYKKYIALVNKK